MMIMMISLFINFDYYNNHYHDDNDNIVDNHFYDVDVLYHEFYYNYDVDNMINLIYDDKAEDDDNDNEYDYDDH